MDPNLGSLLESFCRLRKADAECDLWKQLQQYPPELVVTEYANLYNATRQSCNWQFYWIFRLLPMKGRLQLIEQALDSLKKSRSRFQKCLISNNSYDLGYLLKVPQDSPFAILIKYLDYGWAYNVGELHTRGQQKERDLREIIKLVNAYM